MTITARDICPQCSHLWHEHEEGRIPVAPYTKWVKVKGRGKFIPDPGPCKCCQRMSARVKELNAQ